MTRGEKEVEGEEGRWMNREGREGVGSSCLRLFSLSNKLFKLFGGNKGNLSVCLYV